MTVLLVAVVTTVLLLVVWNKAVVMEPVLLEMAVVVLTKAVAVRWWRLCRWRLLY